MKSAIVAIVLLFPLNLMAGEIFGNWEFDDSLGDAKIARTSNDSGNVLGFICINNSDHTCAPYVVPSSDCDIGSTYNTIVNSISGSHADVMECIKVGSIKIFVLTDKAKMSRAFESGGDIGVVIPLEDSKFKAMRFSTKGALPAIRKSMERFNLSPSSGRDEIIL